MSSKEVRGRREVQDDEVGAVGLKMKLLGDNLGT